MVCASTLIETFCWLDWIEQCFTSPPTQYRLYGRRFLQVKSPNQQYQSTEGTYSKPIMQKYTIMRHINTNTASSLVYTNMWVTRGWLPQRADLPCLNGGGTGMISCGCAGRGKESCNKDRTTTEDNYNSWWASSLAEPKLCTSVATRYAELLVSVL